MTRPAALAGLGRQPGRNRSGIGFAVAGYNHHHMRDVRERWFA